MNYFSFSVDPVDGTMNFVHSFPYSCISLAVAFQKEVHIGIIYKYIKKQYYTFVMYYILLTHMQSYAGSNVYSLFGKGSFPQ